MPLDLTPTQWKLAGQFVSVRDTRTALPASLPYRFTKRILKVSSDSRSTASTPVGERWRRAGYLAQVINREEICSRVVLLNRETILSFPLLTASYHLAFTPVGWLPNLTVKVYEYQGPETEDLLQEFLLL